MGDDTPDTVIHVESMLSARDETPYVTLTWGNMTGKLTPIEARLHALAILEAAEAAEGDSLVNRWLRDRVGVDKIEARAAVLFAFRELRDGSSKPKRLDLEIAAITKEDELPGGE